MSVRFTGTVAKALSRTDGPTHGGYTICFWARITVDLNTYSSPCCLANVNQNTFVIAATDVDGTTMNFWNANSGPIVGPNMAVGGWYFFAWTVNGNPGTLTAYWSPAGGGALSSGAAVGLNTANAIDTLLIGMNKDSETWDGNVQSVKAWSAVLTQDEIQNEMFALTPKRTANLWAFYPLLTQPDGLIDYSGNTRNLTAGATPTTTEDGPSVGWGGPA
jgi:hypothetical protein